MAKKTESSSLLRALDFVSLAQRDKGAPYQTHVVLRNRTAVSFDGVLAAGHLIDEDLNACPHTLTLLAALRKATGVLSVTQLANTKLSVRSGKFRATVPCLPDAVIPGIAPDPQVGIIDNRIRIGLEMVSPFIIENSQRVVMASALIRANSILATNGHVLMEYWHGIDMPPGLIVPKVFINALSKIKKNLIGFGFSQSSFTVYFEGDCWLKTQLYNERWPDCDSILAKPHNPQPLPPTFFEALDTVAEFADDHRIRLHNGKITTHADADTGASYEVEGLVADVVLNARHLAPLDGLIKSIDFNGTDNITFFYGDNLRGALSQLKD